VGNGARRRSDVCSTAETHPLHTRTLQQPRSFAVSLGCSRLTGYIIPLPFVGRLKLSNSARESSLDMPANAALNASRVVLFAPPRPRPRPLPPRDIERR
jgi:hypothetical protein